MAVQYFQFSAALVLTALHGVMRSLVWQKEERAVHDCLSALRRLAEGH